MSEREWFLLERKCLRKRGKFKSKKQAHRRAREIYRVSGVKMYPYYCNFCKLVHLTKNIEAKGQTL